MSSLDSRAANVGGRQNGWRVINLTELLPQQSQRLQLKERRFSVQKQKQQLRKSSMSDSSVTVKIKHRVSPSSTELVKKAMIDIDDDFEDLYEWTVSLDDIA